MILVAWYHLFWYYCCILLLSTMAMWHVSFLKTIMKENNNSFPVLVLKWHFFDKEFLSFPSVNNTKMSNKASPCHSWESFSVLADFNEASATPWHSYSGRSRRRCCCPGNWKWTAKDLAARGVLGTTRAKNQRVGMTQPWKLKTSIGCSTHWEESRAQRLWGLNQVWKST